jgi:acetyltransferase-like isoleucine patch superfamily enzyme
MLPRAVSLPFVHLYRQLLRVKTKAFSVMASGAFAEFGEKSILVPPIRLAGESRIAIGDQVCIGSRSWIQTLPSCPAHVGLRIGNGTGISGSCVISAACNITIEDNVVIASNVCIVDHLHCYADPNRPISLQGIEKIAPILIRQNSWIGENVVILPGVTIGRNSVIGANSVVNRSIPDYSVAAGAPAIVVKRLIDGRFVRA